MLTEDDPKMNADKLMHVVTDITVRTSCGLEMAQVGHTVRN